jgi:hypothetical protein
MSEAELYVLRARLNGGIRNCPLQTEQESIVEKPRMVDAIRVAAPWAGRPLPVMAAPGDGMGCLSERCSIGT